LEKIGKKFREKGIIFTMQLEKGKSGGKYKYLKYSKKELEIIKNFRKNILKISYNCGKIISYVLVTI